MVRGDDRLPTYARSTWWFGRGLGLTFFVAFASLHLEIDGLLGEHGVVPVVSWFPAFVEQGGSFFDCPTLAFVFGADDSGLNAMCLIGELASAAVLLGVLPGPAVLIATIAYLSLHSIGAPFLSFQWDTLLIESGFLGALVLPWRGFDAPSRALAPPGFARWAVYALVFRLMFSSGVVKLASDPAWRSGRALEYHYFTQPLPNPPAYVAHHLPWWVNRISAFVALIIEAGFPWLILIGGVLALAGVIGRAAKSERVGRLGAVSVWPLRLAFAGFAGLMFLIALTGNYGFFNLLTAVLCLPLLDDDAIERLTPRRLRAMLSPTHLRPGTLRSAMRLTQCSLLLFTYYLGFVSLLLGLGAGPSLPSAVVEDASRIASFRVTNSYGLFAVMTKSRREIHLEGSADGVRWERYAFRDKPGDPDRAPPIAGLHMPRLDWQMWFAALGSLDDNPWLVMLMERLLDAEPTVLELLEDDPFEGARPRFIRAVIEDYTFTEWSEPGYWRVEPIGPYSPVLTRVDGQLVVVQ